MATRSVESATTAATILSNNGIGSATSLGALAHSTHVRGVGTYANGVERCRIQVTLATGIPESECHAVGLGYRDPAGIVPEGWANRESEGILMVPKAGEILHRLRNTPDWCRFPATPPADHQ
jgi:hypothetical protein